MRPSDLLNLGPACDRMLAAVGITTAERLRELGAVEAYLMVKEADVPGASIMLLWAMHGALTDTHWRDVTDDVKADLRRQVQ